jgi:hypothetical protein
MLDVTIVITLPGRQKKKLRHLCRVALIYINVWLALTV